MGDKYIILGVTGSIAAYKTPDLVRRIRGEGFCGVRAVLTEAAQRFVTPLSLEVVSENPVLSDIFQTPLAHIDVARDASALLVAPATLNTISSFAAALCSNLLENLFMVFKGPVLIAPAMNWRMYENPVFRDKLEYLKDKGVIEIPPECGQLACGEEGRGRMASFEAIITSLRRALAPQDMVGMKVVVTGGPTREYIDSVRFISNRSSGKMGAALALAAHLRGANVTYITGPSSIAPAPGVETVEVETSGRMQAAVMHACRGAHVLLMSAAVCDFTPDKALDGKLERTGDLTLRLSATPDIVAEVAALQPRPFIAAFSAEYGADVERARMKRLKKGVDMMVFNDVTAQGAGFDSDTNIVTIITGDGEFALEKMSKFDVSNSILDKALHAGAGRGAGTGSDPGAGRGASRG
jgi:phosphopantothenoylcysteine decarboxylase/phosphopantothenate--cysteine ligase